MRKIVEFYPNGVLKETGWEDEKGKQGEWIFYDENGTVFIECNYRDDIKNGEFVRYNENGSIACHTLYLDGLHDGKGIEFYEDGRPKEEWIYSHGEYSPINYWDESGKQLMKDGTGKKIAEYASGLKIEQYFEQSVFVKEIRLNEITFGKFTPDDPS